MAKGPPQLGLSSTKDFWQKKRRQQCEKGNNGWFREGVPSREGEIQWRKLENVLLGEGKANMELVS